jgi:snRNA-activating protein complex subunit 3
LAQTGPASDVYRSSFFFINNVFYSDMRHPGHRDYSEVIRNWAAESGRGIGPLEYQRMETTRFEDLELQLGYPYLYLHQGDCEHLLVFTDLRLLTPSADSTDLKDYPKFVSTTRRTQIRCGLCSLNTGKWVTFGCQRLPEEPYYFCDSCFRSFNYDKDGNKRGHFKAFPYLDRTALL